MAPTLQDVGRTIPTGGNGTMNKLLFASSLFALLGLAVACSSGGSSDDPSVDNTDDELKSGQICGGFAGLTCPKGKTCKITANHPDASGRCVTPKMGEEGSMCGGIANIQCKAGLECQYDDDTSNAPTHPVMGMPIKPDAGDHSSGPPPGALGLPIPSDPSGTCVPAAPIKLGLPIKKDAGPSSGPPPGALGLPIHH